MTPSPDPCVVGIDFGTLSGRALVVRVSDGKELGSAVHAFSHGVLEQALPDGTPLDPSWALQVPDDYIDVLRVAVPEALRAAGVDPGQVVGVATDFTACTVLPTLEDGTPLCELSQFASRPHAYPKLWRHHAAQPHADRITELAHQRREPWIDRYGGRVSSEWEFAKALQLLEEDPSLYAEMRYWVEASDWIVWQLCGRYVRNVCAAGYKGQFQDGTYPTEDFCAALHPDFRDFVETKLDAVMGELGAAAGLLTDQAAAWTNLRAGIPVAVGNVDAHTTAAAANAMAPGQMTAIMGTSTCHVMTGDRLAAVPGMCGVVDGGIVAGLWGYEAGQSGVGDIFGWFVRTCVPAGYEEAAAQRGLGIHQYLSSLAADQEVGEHGLVALDWHSGNRSVLVDHDLSGLVIGQTLSTKPEDTYRALLEATAFGTRTIIEAFNAAGLEVSELVVAGGLAKNELLMQIYADVTRLPLSIIASDQGPALGAAIHAAVAAGLHPDVPAAAAAMGGRGASVYKPNTYAADRYDTLYTEYQRLHDTFGRLSDPAANPVMHRLREISRQAKAGRP